MTPEQVTLALVTLVARVGNLQPAIVAMMPPTLREPVEEARRLAPYMSRLADVVADGMLLRDVLAISIDPDKYATFSDIVEGVTASDGYENPTTVDAARAQMKSVTEQTNRVHPS